MAILLGLVALTNLFYHVIRKPTELFFPVSGALAKTPSETWYQYGSLFQEHSTAVIAPDLLAALAQVEGSGDPVARTYWRWQFTWNPLAVYQPASSAVGMFQITDGTFAEARRFCIQDHAVAEDACWFRSLYTRVVPSHAVELTAALLDRQVATTLARREDRARDAAAAAGPRRRDPPLRRGRGRRLRAARLPLHRGPALRRSFVTAYLVRVNALQRQFLRLAADDGN